MCVIDHSVLTGATDAVSHLSGDTTYIGNSQLQWGDTSGNFVCAGIYDENFTFAVL